MQEQQQQQLSMAAVAALEERLAHLETQQSKERVRLLRDTKQLLEATISARREGAHPANLCGQPVVEDAIQTRRQVAPRHENTLGVCVVHVQNKDGNETGGFTKRSEATVGGV